MSWQGQMCVFLFIWLQFAASLYFYICSFCFIVALPAEPLAAFMLEKVPAPWAGRALGCMYLGASASHFAVACYPSQGLGWRL